MKTKDIKNLHAKTAAELMGMYKTLKDEVLQLNLEKAQSKLKDTRSIFWKKKYIARVLTILKEKEFEATALKADSK